MKILLTFPVLKSATRTLIEERLYEEFGSKNLAPTFVPATTQDKALARIKESGEPDLIISHMQLPSSDKSAPDPRGGLALVRELRKRGMKSSAILISEFTDNEIQAGLDQLDHCRLVIEGPQDWETNLVERCREELAMKEGGKARTLLEHRGEVDIFFNLDQTPQGRYRMCAPGYTVPDQPLKLDVFIMKDLARRSNHVRELEDWQGEFHAIGNFLLRELFMQNYTFSQHFKDLLHRSGGEENVRIRFIVEKATHPIALEALLDERDEFWMVHAPVYRTVQVDGVKSPLFGEELERDHPLRCLVIEADTCGSVTDIRGHEGAKLELGSLPDAQDECTDLRRFLKAKAADFPIKKVEPLGGRQRATLERFQKVITEQGPWQLVHFAGHSFYDEGQDVGYVFFPGKTGPEPLPVDDFARYLRGADTRFVYLSSCQSSSADFAFALAKQGVPAIVGFRWDIDDEAARAHANIFYRKLFEGGRRLEDAFFETRKKMHNDKKYHNNRIWAAAMLIVQVEKF